MYAHVEGDQFRDNFRVQYAIKLVAVAFLVVYLKRVFFQRFVKKIAEFLKRWQRVRSQKIAALER